MSALDRLAVLFPPPVEVERRGWECALVLLSEFPERLTEGEAADMARIQAQPALSWRDIGLAFATYRRNVEARV